MSSIDQRVVQMQFDNKQFEQGVKTTLNTLDTLNKGLKLEGATKGLTDVSNAAKLFSLGGLASGIDGIAEKFKNLSVVGITVLANLTTEALRVGTELVKSFTIAPILQGLDVYQTKINAIQTILANTGAAGTTLKQVTDALNVLNVYANQTVYNFGEMTKNIGTFTAAGVDLQTSVSAIKGIANLAALSGSSAEQASVAMYQLSQAIAAGSVKLQDWNSVVNAGLGGKTFQNALIATARAHGIAVDAMIKKNGSFRESLQEGWVTAKVLTDTLAQFTGDLNDQQLRSMGFTEQQAQSIIKLGKVAVDSATKIRTVTQLQSALSEEVATAWSTVWETLIGDIGSATDLLSSVHTTLENAFTGPVYALNALLQEWDKLGGRTLILKSIANGFEALGAILKPIGQAFKEVFPPATGQQLYNLSFAIEKFTEHLKIGATTANELKRSFAGVFAVLGIGWDIIKQGAILLARLFGVATTGSGGFLEVTAKIGDFLVAMKQAIEEGHGLELFFGRLGNFLEPPLRLIGLLAQALEHVFDKFDPEKAAKDVTGLVAKLEPITRIGDLIAVIWGAAALGIEKAWKVFAPIAQKIGAFFAAFGKWVASGFDNIQWQNVLATINTGLLAGLVVIIKKFFDKFKGGGLGEGFLDTIKESFEGLTKTLETMQTTLRAATLLEIALAVSALTISVVALSHIDSQGLARALSAMAIMFTELLSSMTILEKVIGTKGFLKIPFIAASLTLLAIAVDVLTIAVRNLSGLSWSELTKGLTGVGIILAELTAALRLMPKAPSLVLTATGLVILSSAIRILVTAVTDLSGLSWQEMEKGLTGVGALLVALALFTKFADAGKAGVLQGTGIVLLAVGINLLAKAVQTFSGLSWGEIGKGLVTLAGALAIIVAALDLIPPTAPLSAAGVLIVAYSLAKVADALQVMGQMSWAAIGKGLTAMLGALTLIAAALDVISPTAPLSAAGVLIVALSLGMIGDALERFSKMSWGEIGKAVTVLGASLLIIAVAVDAMSGALTGAAAILIVAAALAILTPILLTFSQMSWTEIAKGLVALAGVFVILGAAGLLLAPVVPILIGLGIAVTLLGVGMLAAGVGLLAFSVGLTALSVAGAAGAAAIVAIVSGLIGLIPQVMTEIGLGIVAFAQVISTAGPAITQAITTVLLALITAINTLAPQINATLYKLLLLLLDTMVKAIPKMVDAGQKILIGVLTGIANNIGGVVAAATSVVVNFINGVAANLPRVIQAGVNLILAYINGLANAIRNNSAAMGDAGANLATAIIEGMVRGLGSGVGRVIQAAKNVAQQALNAALNLLGINSPSKEFIKIGMGVNEGFALGLTKFSHMTAAAAEDVSQMAIDSATNTLSNLSDLVSGDMNLTPIVTPVLDLTNLKKDAGSINRVLAGSVPISVDTSFSKAQDVSGDFPNNQTPDNQPPGSGGGDVIFNQYNSSPKALSSADIYRQTKNQLSKAKEVVGS